MFDYTEDVKELAGQLYEVTPEGRVDFGGDSERDTYEKALESPWVVSPADCHPCYGAADARGNVIDNLGEGGVFERMVADGKATYAQVGEMVCRGEWAKLDSWARVYVLSDAVHALRVEEARYWALEHGLDMPVVDDSEVLA